jgi:CheY-like chemotaxis protein
MRLSIPPRNVSVQPRGSLPWQEWPTVRVLLGSSDSARRSRIADSLHKISASVAFTSNECQTIARASMVCLDRGWRRRTGSDFDLILIDVELLEKADEFVRKIQRTGYDGPIVAIVTGRLQKRHLLSAGFSGFWRFSSVPSDRILRSLERYCRRSYSLIEPAHDPFVPWGLRR